MPPPLSRASLPMCRAGLPNSSLRDSREPLLLAGGQRGRGWGVSAQAATCWPFLTPAQKLCPSNPMLLMREIMGPTLQEELMVNVRCELTFSRYHLLGHVGEVTPAEIPCLWLLPPSIPIVTTQGFLTAPSLLHCSVSCNSIAVPSLTSGAQEVTCPAVVRPLCFYCK